LEKYQPGVGIAAGSMMLKYEELSGLLDHRKVQAGNSVNIFISVESILKQLTTIKTLSTLMAFHKQKVVLELESAIMNLVAHYRSYFRRAKCTVSVYLYYTELQTDNQLMREFNKYYRSYYSNHYTKNPNHKSIGELMDIVIPEVELMLMYIPQCYLVRVNRFDASLIPSIISDHKPVDHNLIISSDLFDSLYFYRPRFTTIIHRRYFANVSTVSNPESAVQSIIRDESAMDCNVFLKEELYYRLLLVVHGSDIRNITGGRGLGTKRLLSILRNGIEAGMVLSGYNSIDSILSIFPEKYQSDLKVGLECVDLNKQLMLLGKADSDSVIAKLVDRTDNSGVLSLNNKRFIDFQINLTGLLE
jgi:hypothetical protein